MASADSEGWRAALRRALGYGEVDTEASAGDGTDVGGPTDDGDLAADVDAAEALRVEEIMLRGPRRYSQRQMRELTDIGEERGQRLWRALGFADVDEDEAVFTDGDLEAVGQLEQLRATGLISVDLQDAAIRSMSQTMAGLAEWQVELLYHLLSESPRPPGQRTTDLARLVPALEELQDYVWRRHLAVAAGRLMASAPDEADVRMLTVGSTDLVGFTRTARRLTPSQLIELIELFHGIAGDLIADHGGRIVKTVGDAVLFVTDRPEDAADIALELLARSVDVSEMPELRTGLATGSVLTRFGDIYGEVVDNASRLCVHARPGRILIEQELARRLRDNPRYSLRLRRQISDRGYPRLHPWGLRPGS
ncbi:MAG TPA: adenylate/guanylate cyclase domain-containing protein [Pseudonocardia sp.]|uniref:adenylate/guanylate cyclase domain-containing protein n=1 Tax=Pseudonocardia sp. TaxID=60912 RepID=UPI002F3ED0AA